MQGGNTIFALGIHGGLLLKQQLRNLDVAVFGRQMKGSEALLTGCIQGCAMVYQHAGNLRDFIGI